MKKVAGYIFSQNILLSAAFAALLLAVYSLLRAGFYIFNHSLFTANSNHEIITSFVYGIRFDLSAVVMINLPVLLLLNFPLDLWRLRLYRVTAFVLFIVINTAAIALNIADYVYYPAVERRLLYEPYTMLPDIIRMSPGLAIDYSGLLVILIIIGVLIIIISRMLYKKLSSKFKMSFSYLRAVLSFVVIGVLCTIAIRGGLQMKPIRIANAFPSSNSQLGYLTLNSTYTVMQSYFQDKLPVLDLMTEHEANDIIDGMLRSKDEVFIDKEYPFMRKKIPQEEMHKLNVVIFIMESWSAAQVGSINGGISRTPFFDSLAAGGVLFTNFYSNGQRSIEGIPSILASLPAIYNVSIIGSVEETYRFRGLGSILQEQGYTTSFHHGGITGTMGFDAFSNIAGFTKYYGKESYPDLTDEKTDGMWGVCDEPFFIETERVLSSTPEPFCAVIFSLSSHEPFKIPADRLSLFDAYKNEPDFERSIRYSDHSLREFFARAVNERWYANTLFIFTSDHTMYTSRNNFISTFHSPLLLYAPGVLNSSRISRPACQSDILPTIVDILKIPAVHSSMGSSLLDTAIGRYVILKYTPFYAIMAEDYVVMNDLENQPKLYEYKKDPLLKNDLYQAKRIIAEDLNRKLYAYLQKSTHAIGENRIYR